MKSIPQDDVYDAFIVMHNKLRDNLKLILYPMLDQLISLKDKAVSSSPRRQSSIPGFPSFCGKTTLSQNSSLKTSLTTAYIPSV